ncbi:uncharacterized protein LOC134246120 [Saccostrea cucullata]|uniref:uncharacterized protein LOC134246120 n=1 Tax=Saccostrea cuccullata TaxID=36930 RepID=UPI002ED1B20B
MDLTGSRFALVITIEILTLFVYLFCILINILSGSKFSQRDTIFTAVVFSTCCTILGITVLFACRSQNGVSQITNRKMYHKLPPGQRLHASDCAICLSPKEPTSSSLVQLSCKHDYHEKCIKECFKKTGDNRCPKCRAILRDVSTLKSNRSRYLPVLPLLLEIRDKRDMSWKESFV